MTMILKDSKKTFYADVPNFTPIFYVDLFLDYLKSHDIKFYYDPNDFFFPQIDHQPDLFEHLKSWRDYVTFCEVCPL